MERQVSLLSYIQSSTPQDLDDLKDTARQCTLCPIHAHMGKCALYLGTPTALVLVLAEKNGTAEAVLGEPFASPVTRGELMRNLSRAGLHPWQDVRATNLVLCGIPEARPPSQEELKNCQWWYRLVELYPPRLIIALGQVVIEHLKPPESSSRSVTEWNGMQFTWRDIPVVCSYNPAYLIRIRDTNPDLYKQAIAVWRGPVKTLVTKLQKGGMGDRSSHLSRHSGGKSP